MDHFKGCRPLGGAAPQGFVTDVRMLLGHGYAVLTPSLPKPRGTSEPMAGLAQRILAIVDEAVTAPETRGRFDAARLGIWGHSYGGYTVMAAIGQTDRFKAAVAISGAANLTSRWGSAAGAQVAAAPDEAPWSYSAAWVEAVQGGLQVPPWTDPARYARNSPLFQGDRIRTPLMLIHGDQDKDAPAQHDQMFAALARQDKDVVELTYWGEGHVPASPGNVRDLWTRAFGFLDAELGVRPHHGSAAHHGR